MGDSNVQRIVPFLWVHDIVAAIHFYVDGLGFTKTKEWISGGQRRRSWLEPGEAALLLQAFWKERRHRNVPEDKVGVGVSINFICSDALAICRRLVSRGPHATRPFVGNGMWVTQITDPDGYHLCFESLTEMPEETVFAEHA